MAPSDVAFQGRATWVDQMGAMDVSGLRGEGPIEYWTARRFLSHRFGSLHELWHNALGAPLVEQHVLSPGGVTEGAKGIILPL